MAGKFAFVRRCCQLKTATANFFITFDTTKFVS